jgi:hypothetical protein
MLIKQQNLSVNPPTKSAPSLAPLLRQDSLKGFADYLTETRARQEDRARMRAARFIIASSPRLQNCGHYTQINLIHQIQPVQNQQAFVPGANLDSTITRMPFFITAPRLR